MRLPSAMTELARRIIQRVRLTTRVAVMGRVGTYDADAQRATVTPLVPEQDSVEGVPRDLPTPTLQDVPVVHYGGGLRGLTFGLEADDPVLLLVRHRSHQEVDSGAEPPISPQDPRRMALSESVALPTQTTPRPDTQVRSDGAPVLYMDAGEALHIAIATANIALARADLTQTRLDAIQAAFDGHTHSATGILDSTSNPCTGNTAPSGVVGGSNDVATTRVMVDE